MRRSGEGGAAAWAAVATAGLIVATLIAGVSYLFLQREDTPTRATPAFSFELGRVRAVAAEGGNARAEGPAREVHAAMDALYTAAFVDPALWEGGTFSAVLGAFTGPAAERARGDLVDLTLGSAATEVAFVDPGTSRLHLSVLVDGNGSPIAATATARFRARGDLRDGRELTVFHAGRYFLRPVEGQWRISGYDVEGVLEPVDVSPEVSP